MCPNAGSTNLYKARIPIAGPKLLKVFLIKGHTSRSTKRSKAMMGKVIRPKTYCAYGFKTVRASRTDIMGLMNVLVQSLWLSYNFIPKMSPKCSGTPLHHVEHSKF